MKKEVKILAVIGILVIIGAVAGASFYRKSQETVATKTNNSDKSAAFLETLVRPDSPTLGAAYAKVTLVEFLDPECESCAAFSPVVKKIMKDYDGKIRLVIRYMPLHPNSIPAATLIESAGEEGKYWQAFDYLLQKQSEWGTRHGPGSTPQPDTRALFEKYAVDLGLDTAKFQAALRENRFQAKLMRDQKDGQMLGVRQTPTFFVNGRKLMRFGEADLRALIDDELENTK